MSTAQTQSRANRIGARTMEIANRLRFARLSMPDYDLILVACQLAVDEEAQVSAARGGRSGARVTR